MNPMILVVDDQESIGLFLQQTLGDEGFDVSVCLTGSEALEAVEKRIPDLVLLDLMLPDMSGLQVLAELKQQFPDLCVVMITAFSEIGTAVQAMRLGAFDYVNKPINLEQLLVVIQKGLAASRTSRDLHLIHRQNDLIEGDDDFVPSRSPAMQPVYDTVRKVAASEGTTILIEGESGVGKDVVANLIHRLSPRRDHPFLEINCASLPETLLESELFGHEKGAFTDAGTQKMGLLELAHKGTLFLDEIGEMSLPIQVKLLRVLEKMNFRRVGGLKDITIDVRILAATNRNLSSLVAAGAFRQDLYYRLKVVLLRIPPLRERKEDIPQLAGHFLAHFNAHFHKVFNGISGGALEVLQNYPWPGNIRELKNVIERAVLLEEGRQLLPEHLRLSGRAPAADHLASIIEKVLREPLPAEGIALDELMAGFEETLVRKAFQSSGGNQSKAARLLGLNRDKFRYRLKAYDVHDS